MEWNSNSTVQQAIWEVKNSEQIYISGFHESVIGEDGHLPPPVLPLVDQQSGCWWRGRRGGTWGWWWRSTRACDCQIDRERCKKRGRCLELLNRGAQVSVLREALLLLALPEDSREMAPRGPRPPVFPLWQEVQKPKRGEETRDDPHWRETTQVPPLPNKIYPKGIHRLRCHHW